MKICNGPAPFASCAERIKLRAPLVFMPCSVTHDLIQLRKQLRKQRRQLNRFQQRQAEQQVLQRLRAWPAYRQAQKIGVYLHAFGEIHTTKIIELCFAQGKQVYLPMICNMNDRLVWVRIQQGQYRNKRFAYHRLGMQEPMASRGQHVSELDLLLMPLLACDRHGTRIGMGGGYYDKTLASAPTTPLRVGLCHDFQIVDVPLAREAWDQPLDALISPHFQYSFQRKFAIYNH